MADQRERGERIGSCLGSVPNSPAPPHAYHGVKLLTDIRNQEGNTAKREMMRFRRAREKGAMAFVER